MELQLERLLQVEDVTLTENDGATLACQLAKQSEIAGDYEKAQQLLGDFWQGLGHYPRVENLPQPLAAEVLLRAGVLTGQLGSSRQFEGLQETAKNLISESVRIFETLHAVDKTHEARLDLAVCYWREGAYEEARVILRGVLGEIGGEVSELKALALLRSAVVERSASRHRDALQILSEAAPLFEVINNHALKGQFHGQRALVLNYLDAAEKNEEYTDRAFVEYEAAIFHFEMAGHARYVARTENNLGFLFLVNEKPAEAHEHLGRARQLFDELRDSGSVAQVDETRARVFLFEGRFPEAEKTAREAVQSLEQGDERSLFAQALTTYGTALARLQCHELSVEIFRRAATVAEQAGDIDGAGLAYLSLIEELPEYISHEELRSSYQLADDCLSHTQDAGMLKRLRVCARKILEARSPVTSAPAATEFIYGDSRTGDLLQDARLIAGTSRTVLLTGETGTGKDVLARLIHSWSGRTGKLVTINCASIHEGLFESQIFGHDKDNFTDAREGYAGAVHAAAGGTLFLDEISALSPDNQAKLLRLVEDGETRRPGTSFPEHVDVRVIAATNSNLEEFVASGRFREDLLYRLQAFTLYLPPLRKRQEDIAPLAAHFINNARAQYGKRVSFAPEAVAALSALPLKGNARELQSHIERMMLAAEDNAVITPAMIEATELRQMAKTDLMKPWEGFSLKDEIHRIERRFIELALKEAGGKVSHAARLLGFKHHESLNSLLKHGHQDLLEARQPVTPRRRSIIRKRGQ